MGWGKICFGAIFIVFAIHFGLYVVGRQEPQPFKMTSPLFEFGDDDIYDGRQVEEGTFKIQISLDDFVNKAYAQKIKPLVVIQSSQPNYIRMTVRGWLPRAGFDPMLYYTEQHFEIPFPSGYKPGAVTRVSHNTFEVAPQINDDSFSFPYIFVVLFGGLGLGLILAGMFKS